MGRQNSEFCPPPTTALPGGATSTNTQTATATGGGCALGAGTLPGSPGIPLGLLGALGLLRLRRSSGTARS